MRKGVKIHFLLLVPVLNVQLIINVLIVLKALMAIVLLLVIGVTARINAAHMMIQDFTEHAQNQNRFQQNVKRFPIAILALVRIVSGGIPTKNVAPLLKPVTVKYVLD